ncbi:MAG: transglutaminase family protein [Nibricoccus sp.]
MPRSSPTSPNRLGRTADDAGRYAHALAANLRVDEQWILPGYEDSFYYLWKERRLPTNVDPLKSNLKDPLERERLARVFEQGLEQVIGYALPLERGYVKGNPGWVSGPWFLRQETIYLIPGDSPMGFRLPLDSIPWVAKGDYPLDPHAA